MRAGSATVASAGRSGARSASAASVRNPSRTKAGDVRSRRVRKFRSDSRSFTPNAFSIAKPMSTKSSESAPSSVMRRESRRMSLSGTARLVAMSALTRGRIDCTVLSVIGYRWPARWTWRIITPEKTRVPGGSHGHRIEPDVADASDLRADGGQRTGAAAAGALRDRLSRTRSPVRLGLVAGAAPRRHRPRAAPLRRRSAIQQSAWDRQSFRPAGARRPPPDPAIAGLTGRSGLEHLQQRARVVHGGVRLLPPASRPRADDPALRRSGPASRSDADADRVSPAQRTVPRAASPRPTAGRRGAGADSRHVRAYRCARGRRPALPVRRSADARRPRARVGGGAAAAAARLRRADAGAGGDAARDPPRPRGVALAPDRRVRAAPLHGGVLGETEPGE